MLRANALIPMSELMQWRFQGARAVFANDEANSIIDFIVRTSGAKALMNVLDGIGRGQNPSVAFRQALGADEATVFNLWLRDLAREK